MVERRPGIWPAERELLELVRARLEEEEREQGGGNGVEGFRRMDKDATLAPRMAGTWPRRALR